MGCVHIYCGDGKGKTTAAVGLAVRMQGSGGRVVAARFLKTDGSGEVAALSSLPNVAVLPCRRSFGFTWQMTEEQRREAAACYEELLSEAFRLSEEACREEESRRTEAGGREGRHPPAEGEGREEEIRPAEAGGCGEETLPAGEDCRVLLILDEICAAVGSGLVGEERVLEFLRRRPRNLEVVLTGRNPSAAMEAEADYISEILCRKHPFERGLKARRGIEF